MWRDMGALKRLLMGDLIRERNEFAKRAMEGRAGARGGTAGRREMSPTSPWERRTRASRVSAHFGTQGALPRVLGAPGSVHVDHGGDGL